MKFHRNTLLYWNTYILDSRRSVLTAIILYFFLSFSFFPPFFLFFLSSLLSFSHFAIFINDTLIARCRINDVRRLRDVRGIRRMCETVMQYRGCTYERKERRKKQKDRKKRNDERNERRQKKKRKGWKKSGKNLSSGTNYGRWKKCR